jgi:hypothetical protein
MSQQIVQPEVQASEFSLMQGGLFYRLNVMLKLCGPRLEFSERKMIALIAITWLPLFILSSMHAPIPDLKVPFLYNIEVHIRFLIALPTFIFAEVVANNRIRMLIKQFTLRNIIVPDDVPLLNKAIARATRLNSLAIVDIVLIILVFTLGNWTWGENFSIDRVNTWYAIVKGDVKHFTSAGDWYAFVSLPIFQFILLRWLFHLIVFGYLLHQISKINLQLTPIHPDRAGGIGFLRTYLDLIVPFVFALSTLSAGGIAGKILFEGVNLYDLRITILVYVLITVCITITPLLLFARKLHNSKRRNFREYGILSTRYVQDFHDKWITGKIKHEDTLLGSPDIQSLADLDGSYSIIREMRLVPFTIREFASLVIIAIVPFLPLLLTVMSIEKIAEWIFATLF